MKKITIPEVDEGNCQLLVLPQYLSGSCSISPTSVPDSVKERLIAKMTKMLEEDMFGELGNIKLQQTVLYYIGR